MEDLSQYRVQVTESTRSKEEGVHQAGAFDKEYKVSGAYCVVKRPNCEKPSAGRHESTAQLVSACRLHSSLRHPNIVQFIGVVYGEDGGGSCLVWERMNASLASSLEAYPNIPVQIKLSVLRDVSAGLLYLHSFAPPIIHGDLTTTNILLTPDWRAKIADFGNTVDGSFFAISSDALPYMPPEVLIRPPTYDYKLDIFSFGIVALYVGIQSSDADRNKRQEQLVTLRNTPEVECLYQIVAWCCEHDPNKRPSSRDLNNHLQTLCTANPLPYKDMVHLYKEVSKGRIAIYCKYWVPHSWHILEWVV